MGRALPAEQQFRGFLQAEFADARRDYPDTIYTSAFADLNGDGRAEALVSLQSGMFCGSGGCSLYVYEQAGNSWRQVAELVIVDAPVRLLFTRSHGWRDLEVSLRGLGAEPPAEARAVFDGRTYVYVASSSAARRPRARAPGIVLNGGARPGRLLF
jgi:hypothetical protein